MLAHHPLTGQPIKILRTAPQIASTPTLVLVSAAMAPSPRYSRYSVAVADPAALSVSEKVAVVVALDRADEWRAALPSALAKNPALLLFAPRALAETLPTDRVLFLEDMADAYPWMGEPLSNSIEHVLLFVAHLLRFSTLYWPCAVERDELPLPARLLYDSWRKSLGGVLKATGLDDSFVPRTTLIQQYYEPSQGRRHREIYACLEKNVASPYIDHILLLNEKEFTGLPASSKVTQRILGHRMTYYDAFQAALSVPAGDLVLIANSDIWFNETLSHLWTLPMVEKSLFLALLRWEDVASGAPTIFGPRPDSQDTWIFARDSLTFPIAELDYPFGQSGCDNAIALDMMRQKMLVANPAYTIKTMHLHRSNIRNYDPKNVLYRPFYLHVDPTAIQTAQVDARMDTVRCGAEIAEQWLKSKARESFVRPILTTDPEIERTVCTMLSRDAWNYVVASQNRYVPPATPLPLYRIQGGAFVSATGIVSDWRHLYVGPHKRWVAGWEGARNTLLTQCVQVESALSLPCSPAALASLGRWVLDYVPQVLLVYEVLLRSGTGALPEFGAPSVPHIGEFLAASRWPGLEGKSVNVLPLLEDVQVYATDVWAVPPSDEPALLTREDVARLRSLLPEVPRSGGSCAVLCVDGVLTREWADSVSEYILRRGWTVKTLIASDSFLVRRDALQSADWIIGFGDALDWIWCAREGTTVLEFMIDQTPVGHRIHLAGAAGLRYIAATIRAEPVEIQRQNALLEVGRAIQQFGFKELLTTTRGDVVPFLTLPKGKGLSGHFAHSGDTFREMARIWGERGYCTIKESEDTHHCWWGEIGEILLYDRPTLRWHDDKASYQMGLFGNCAPPDRRRDSTWCFWPRSPAAIEAVAESVACLRTWSERTLPSLFLGKIENGVQLAARQATDWSKSVALFSMPVDTTGAPYPYTQSQYLGKLCSARFGLCLPGFGKKCNREIEYFACGTVPIVTPGVDMTNYLVAPKAGVHYFVANTPEEVRSIVATTTKETWTAMSVAGRTWWRNYASAEGLFRLTWARIEQCRPYFTVGIPPTFL